MNHLPSTKKFMRLTNIQDDSINLSLSPPPRLTKKLPLLPLPFVSHEYSITQLLNSSSFRFKKHSNLFSPHEQSSDYYLFNFIIYRLSRALPPPLRP